MLSHSQRPIACVTQNMDQLMLPKALETKSSSETSDQMYGELAEIDHETRRG